MCHKLRYLLVLVGLWCPVAHAAIYVEITGGQAGGLPIAVLPFTVSGATAASLSDMAQVIQDDLQNSGQFDCLARAQMPEHPKTVGTQVPSLRAPLWQKLNIENVALGHIHKTGLDYTVHFTLFDTVKNDPARQPVLNLVFEHIASDQFRALAHQISDQIFHRLLGVAGIFSTRISYVHVEERAGQTYYTLEVADQDGFNAKPLKRSIYPLMSPAWSPDGKRIAYVSFEHNRSSVQIVDVASGRTEPLSHFPGINGAPSWSPDGQRLALVLSKDGIPKIYTLSLHDKTPKPLTREHALETEPFWAPDGQSMVFTSNRGGKAQIYRYWFNQNKIERLSFKGVYNARPSLTPDGKHLVMMHRAAANGPFSIAVQNLMTGELNQLTHAALDESPCVSPNGMMVIYGSQEGVLGAVSLDGRIKVRLPARSGRVQEPAWSPYLIQK